MYKYTTIKCRVYPNKFQSQLIDLTFKKSREMFNRILSLEYELYNSFKAAKTNGTMNKIKFQKNFFRTHKRTTLTYLKDDDDFKKVDHLALESEDRAVYTAFRQFFRGITKEPKFKKRKDRNSYTTRNVYNNIRIVNNYLRLPKLGLIKCRGLLSSSNPNHVIRTVTVSENKNKCYYVTITMKTFITPTYSTSGNIPSKIVGLDFKISDIFVSSENYRPIYLAPYKANLDRIHILEKRLKRKIKFSKGWYKLLHRLNNLHRHVANIRKNFFNIISKQLCGKFDFISVESLSMCDIAKKLHNGINIYDTSYYKFCTMLRYKIRGFLIYIDKWYPSSKTCSNCGFKKRRFNFKQQVYICNKCHLRIDRDLNAAINIKNEGIRILQSTVI